MKKKSTKTEKIVNLLEKNGKNLNFFPKKMGNVDQKVVKVLETGGKMCCTPY